MSQQPQTVETDLRAGEVGIALLAAASFYFGGWLGIFPALWFLYAIAEANLPPEQRQKLLGPARVTWRYARHGELPEGTPRWAARALGGYVPRAELPAPAAEEAAPAAPAPRAAAQTAGAPAPRPEWLRAINDEPDQRPHTVILGPTRSGKTTMATAAMADRGGRAIVITPKLNPNNWRGAEIVTLDDEGSYAPITAALADIEQEKRRRIKVLRSQGAEALEPLTIVFDEIGELAAFEPRAPEAMVSLSSIGAELKMRLIGIGTSDEALGIKRWKATRNNYVRVETSTDRRATINDGVRTVAVAPTESLAIAGRAQLRPWRGEVTLAAAEDEWPSEEELAHLAKQTRSAAHWWKQDAPPARQRKVAAAEGRRPAVVSVRVPEPAPEQLLAGLLADIPEAVRAEVPAISPERAARLAALLGGQGAAVKIGRGEGGDVYVFTGAVADASAPPATPAPSAPAPAITNPRPRGRRESAVNLHARRRKLERKAYYERAAREEISLQSAYDARATGEKGDYNEASRWYRDEKRRMKAS